MNGRKTCLDFGFEQPVSRELTTPDGVFIKEIYLPLPDLLVPQHAHAFGHTTLVVRGKVRAFRHDAHIGDFGPMESIYIEANTLHYLISLEPETLAFCIHNVAKSGGDPIPILVKNDLGKVPASCLAQHAELSKAA